MIFIHDKRRQSTGSKALTRKQTRPSKCLTHHEAKRNPQSIAIIRHGGPDSRLRAKVKCDVHAVWGHGGSAPPKHYTDSSQTLFTNTPVTSCLEGKSCHSNKPQKRKYGFYDRNVLSPRLKKHWCGNTHKTNALCFGCTVGLLDEAQNYKHYVSYSRTSIVSLFFCNF